MATEEQEETEKKPDTFQEKFQNLDNRITEEITTKYTKEFDEMIRANQWRINGETFHAALLDDDALDQMEILNKEDVDESKDSRKYREKVRKKACVLIKDMTLEKSKKIEYFPLENLVTAWERRTIRGFHLIREPIPATETIPQV